MTASSNHRQKVKLNLSVTVICHWAWPSSPSSISHRMWPMAWRAWPCVKKFSEAEAIPESAACWGLSANSISCSPDDLSSKYFLEEGSGEGITVASITSLSYAQMLHRAGKEYRSGRSLGTPKHKVRFIIIPVWEKGI